MRTDVAEALEAYLRRAEGELEASRERIREIRFILLELPNHPEFERTMQLGDDAGITTEELLGKIPDLA
jgi:hypothetical protein